jgi:FkbH-like protein/thioester reductase-like protein
MTADGMSYVQTAGRSIETFREWLAQEIGKSSDIGFTEVDFSRPIEELGLSSVHLVRLTGEIEKILDLELEATFFFDFDTLDELCDTLMRMRANRLARSAENAEAAPMPVLVAASFTAEPIEDAILHLMRTLGMPARVTFAGYNQVFQELLNPHSALGSAERGFAVLLVRLEDWFRYATPSSVADAVDRTVDDFLGALAAAAARAKLPVILALAPHSPAAVRALGLSERLDALDARILAGAAAIPGLDVLDLRQIEETYRVGRVWDEARDRIGHIPFTAPCYAALAAAIVRRGAIRLLGPVKVIAVDCDDTLWGGVCGEDGPEGLQVDGPYAELQKFLVDQQRAGKLICLCSKNNEADVLRVFAAHPNMPLQLEHVTAWRINWDRKSDNLRALAAELDLGLDSFIFIDDSPMECAEVSAALPQVLVAPLPANPGAIPAYLKHHWAFDTFAVTEEDRRRTEMYRENRARKALEHSAPTFAAFVEALEVVVDIAAVAEDEVPRAAQLTHRTNQFNASRVTRSEAEILALRQTPGRDLLRVRVRDRFGDYGMVGLCGGHAEGQLYVVDIFMMSCRVLARGVEHAMVRHLAGIAAAAGKDEIVLLFRPAERNQVAQAFFASLGDGITTGPEGEAVRFAPADVEAVLAQALRQRAAPAEAGSQAALASPGLRGAAGPGFDAIARTGPAIDDMLAGIAAEGGMRQRTLAADYVTPRTAWEKKIAAIWRDVLRIDRVGTYDNFFELGGDSLRAAEAFARMWDLGVPEEISLQTVEEPTVAALCLAIEAVRAGEKPTLLADRFSLADEGRLAPDIRLPGFDVDTFDQPMRNVFVTGGTGFIGAYLIDELLRDPATEVHCLVRAATPEAGRQRLVANLRRYGLYRPTLDARIHIVLGDLTEPLLGLAPDAFTALAGRIDSIFHSAAWVNFVYPYQMLKPANVASTETILRLAIAAAPRPIQVHYISTLGVIMSTGYGRTTPVTETTPLLHADNLLNGYEQTKYASDKMVWTAMTERGIPAAIYRPPLVSGLSSGAYQKTDEFLPQLLKGCIQLGTWPAVDTLFEIAPIDFVIKAIVHIARQPRWLNKAYFVLHPASRPAADYIEWHRAFGFPARGLPWDVWKRELLNLGTERLRRNALFPFIDFIRALSEEQVFFPPTDNSQFRAAIAGLDHEIVPPLDLLERYTKHFLSSGFYENLPRVPALAAPAEIAAPRPAAPRPDGLLDERLRFDLGKVNDSETYYVFWTDAPRGLSMVVRYVLFNGPIEEARIAEVWCWFRERNRPANEVAVRMRYPVGHAEIVNTEAVRLRIGPSGYGADRLWGEVGPQSQRLRWDFIVDRRDALALERVRGLDEYEMFPHYQSNGVRHRLNGQVSVNGTVYEIADQIASDGHYWGTKNLRAWSWGHCSQFEGAASCLFEGIAARFNDWTQPSAWLAFVYNGVLYRSDLVDSFYHNRELESDLTSWRFTAERGDIRFTGTLSAHVEDQILIVHPLPDAEYLYTHITYTGDMDLDVERKQDGAWWKTDRLIARGTVAFEVTRKFRNPAVTREFRILRSG